MTTTTLPTPLPALTEFDKARNADKQYARLVAGGIHMRSLSSVWGPIDGTGVNAVDTRRMQDEVYDYIVQRVEDKLVEDEEGMVPTPAPEEPPPPEAVQPDPPADGAPTTQPAVTPQQARLNRALEEQERIMHLAKTARLGRESFNLGWETMSDVGIVNEVSHVSLLRIPHGLQCVVSSSSD